MAQSHASVAPSKSKDSSILLTSVHHLHLEALKKVIDFPLCLLPFDVILFLLLLFTSWVPLIFDFPICFTFTIHFCNSYLHIYTYCFNFDCSGNLIHFLDFPLTLPHVLHLYPYHATWDSGHSHTKVAFHLA